MYYFLYRKQSNIEIVSTYVTNLLTNVTIFPRQLRADLQKDFAGTVKEMQNKLLDFLRKNDNHLQSYFLPEPDTFTSGA